MILLAQQPSLPLPLPGGDSAMAMGALAVGAAMMVWQIYRLPQDKHAEIIQKRLEDEEKAHDKTREKVGELVEEIGRLRGARHK